MSDLTTIETIVAALGTDTPLDAMGLPVRARTVCNRVGFRTARDLIESEDWAALNFRNIGAAVARQVAQRFTDLGLPAPYSPPERGLVEIPEGAWRCQFLCPDGHQCRARHPAYLFDPKRPGYFAWKGGAPARHPRFCVAHMPKSERFAADDE